MRRVCEANTPDQSANFFDPTNKDLSRIRDEIALSVLEQLVDWLKKGGRVAIHDATNSTIARRLNYTLVYAKNLYLLSPYRQLLYERLSKEPEIRVLMIESICNDQVVS